MQTSEKEEDNHSGTSFLFIISLYSVINTTVEYVLHESNTTHAKIIDLKGYLKQLIIHLFTLK